MALIVSRIVPNWIRGSYHRKFATAVGIVLVVVLLLSVGLLMLVQGTVEDNVRTQLETSTENEAAELQNWIANNEENARFVSQMQSVQQGGTNEVQSALQDQLIGLPDEVEGVHLIDTTERTIAHSTDPVLIGDDVNELDMDVHVGTGTGQREADISQVDGTSFSTTYTDLFEFNDEQRIGFLATIEDSGGDVGQAGADSDDLILLTVDPGTRGETFNGLVENTSIVAVDEEDGDIQLSENGSQLGELFSEEGADDQTITGARTGPQTLVQDGDVIAAAPTPGADWVVIAQAAEENAFGVVTDVRNGLIAVLVVVLLGFVVIGALIGRPTSQAIESIARDAEELSNGNIAVDSIGDQSDRVDEVGDAQDAFRETQRYLQTVALQAEALANGEFSSEAFDENVPGELGESLEEMRVELEQYVTDVEQSQEEAREAREEAQALANGLDRQAEVFSETIVAASEGDFTQRLDEETEYESMELIATSFNSMLEEIEQTVVDLQQLANKVEKSSVDVSAGAEDIDEASSEISESADEISAGTTEQTEQFKEVQQEMGQLSSTIEEVAATSDEVATAAQEAATSTEDVAGKAEAIRDDMGELEQTAKTITEEIEGLGEEIARIETVVDVIDEIAEETSILALNASIEAARSDGSTGDEGDGFAVIADEVKDLADETAESTDEIESLINDVQQSTEEVIGSAVEMREQVQDNTARVQDSMDAIGDVADRVDQVSSQVQTVNHTTDDQASAAEEAVSMIDEATEISNQTAEEAQSVATAVEEQSSSTTQVAGTASDLSESAERLREQLDGFETSDGATSVEVEDSGEGDNGDDDDDDGSGSFPDQVGS